jgi:uncharacterized membrane-anchored protein YhcB (DUF1043 family)
MDQNTQFTIGLVVAGFACGLLADRLAHRAAKKRQQKLANGIRSAILRAGRRDA